MIERRRMMLEQGELPSGYKRCKYLKGNHKNSNSYAYIDTLVQDETDTSMTIVVNISYAGAYDRFFGTNLNPTPGAWIMLDSGATFAYYLLGRSRIRVNLSGTHTVTVDGGSFYLDGSLKYTNTTPYKTGKTIWLFGANAGDRGTTAKIYSAIFYASGVIQRNFVPAIDKNGRPCLYDTVTRKPFYSQGTGELGYELEDGTYVAPI